MTIRVNGKISGTVQFPWKVSEEDAAKGSSIASFTATNAPNPLSVTNWIKITVNGVEGYMPFFS